jgi:hypothetical protein
MHNKNVVKECSFLLLQYRKCDDEQQCYAWHAEAATTEINVLRLQKNHTMLQNQQWSPD